jgi:HlyD family secretion protein
LTTIPVVLVATLASAWWIERTAPPTFVTAKVTRADVARSIITTGSVNPVVTVQVGTYVSGPIQSIACDFNTEVKAGQLCAKIDPRTYQQAVDQAKANLQIAIAQLAKDQANLDYAKLAYDRDRRLRETGVVSQDAVDLDKNTFDQAAAQIDLDRATITQRRAALEAAQINLDYTDIVSPVNGIVVSRNVDMGQTVAASFQTPTLFLIAKDLEKMQVDTNVSESDVGAAREGQRAVFTVEAYPERTFEGDVMQVRRAPITVQNIVTYDVVIGCDNPELLLFPGMTADVRIIVDEHRNVLTVPDAALRFDPNGSGGTLPTDGKASPDQRHVWVLRDGKPVQVAVMVGLNDGTRTEIKTGALSTEDRVIIDENESDDGRSKARSRSPFSR